MTSYRLKQQQRASPPPPRRALALKPKRSKVSGRVKQAACDILRHVRNSQTDLNTDFRFGQYYEAEHLVVVWDSILPVYPAQVYADGRWITLKHVRKGNDDTRDEGELSTGYAKLPWPLKPVPPGSWR